MSEHRRYRIAWSHRNFEPNSLRRDYQEHSGRDYLIVTSDHIECSPHWLTGDSDYACRIAAAIGMDADDPAFRRLLVIMTAEAERERLWRHKKAQALYS